jgi:antitoxin (DNA-binding transcriptional repressor) of toxin-antitoxin stability system
MTAINTSDLLSSWPAILARVRQGESIVFLENGLPIATLTPSEPAAEAPAEADDTETWWRGVFAPALPVQPLAAGTGTGETAVLERRPIAPDPSWYRDHDADE